MRLSLAQLCNRFFFLCEVHRRFLWNRALRLALPGFLVLFTLLLVNQIHPIHIIASIRNIPNPDFSQSFTLSQSHRTNDIGSTNVALGGGGYVTGIYLHPRQADLVYIKTDIGGFYRWNPIDQRWIPLTDHFPLEQSNYYGGEALALDPNNPALVYIAAGKYLRDAPGSIFKSTNYGQDWTKLNLDLPMGSNEHKRSVGERLVVSPIDSNLIFFGSRQDSLWKSENAGVTWSKVDSFPGSSRDGIGILSIVLSKESPGLIYANSYGDGIYKSTDTGMTWRKLTGSLQKVNRMAIADHDTLYITSSDTPKVSKYKNERWSDITPAHSDQGFNGLTINPTNSNEILVAQEGIEKTKIYQSLDGGLSWVEKQSSIQNTVPWWPNRFFANHIAALEFDPQSTGRVWFTDWYGVWQTKNINVNPVTWTNYVQGHEEIVTFTLVSPPEGALLLSGVADVDGFFHGNGLDAYPSNSFGHRGPTFQDTYSIAYCAANPLRMVRVGGNRWSSTYTGATSIDGGLTWRSFSSFPSGIMPLRVAVAATEPNVFIIIVSNGQPLYTSDGGITWQLVSGLPNGIKGPWNWSQPLASDAVDSKTFYYYDSTNGKVFRSSNGSASFYLVNDSLPSVKWSSLKTVPGVEGEIWLSLNKLGIYRSKDGGETFSKLDGVEQAYLFDFGKSAQDSIIPALYLYGKVADMGEGIFRSLDWGKTWTRINDNNRPIGNQPNAIEASQQRFGLVFIGTNGRGIYYGTVTKDEQINLSSLHK